MRKRLLGLLLCLVMALILMPVVSASALGTGTGTIVVMDELTGLPIHNADINTDFMSDSTDRDGLCVIDETTDPISVSVLGYEDVIIDAGVAGDATVTVKMKLSPDYGVVCGYVKDGATGLPITSGIEGTGYIYDADAGEYYEDNYFASSSTGSFCIAAPVGKMILEFWDWDTKYAIEYYKDATFLSAATPITVTDGVATKIAPVLGAAASVSGAVTSSDGWTAIDDFAGQYVEAWAVNAKSGLWEPVLYWNDAGPDYVLDNLPAGTYKLAIHTLLVNPSGDPVMMGQELVYSDAWYKSGAAVMCTESNKQSKMALAQTVTVGVGQKRTGINFVLAHPTSAVERIAGATRFDVAATLARKGWDPNGDKSWQGVHDVIIANGENGKEADPLAAAGLAGIYDCPVLLVQTTGIPASTRTVIAEIAKKNPGLEIHIIGGTGSVPDARWYDMRAIPGVSTYKDRIAGATRYDVGVGIAKRMLSYVDGDAESLGGVLVVAGDNVNGFYDALAASPAAYSNWMPILCVQKDAVPPAVATLLAGSLKTAPRYVVNSSTYVSEATKLKVKATARLTTSSNRYTAATQIANACQTREWTSPGSTAVAAKLPDALTGGVFTGRNGGVMLFTDSTSVLQPATKTYITAHKTEIYRGWIFGGTGSVPLAQETSFRSLIK